MPSCFSCGSEIHSHDRVGRAETCPQCRADLHCCRNCKFYDTQAYNECREPMAERVVDKERSNFCDYFELGEGDPQGLRRDRQEAKKKLDSLFKK